MAQHLIKTLEGDRKEDKFVCLWKRNRTIPSESKQDYFKLAYFYAFLDHTITHLKTRFAEELEGALLVTYLIPGKLCTLR